MLIDGDRECKTKKVKFNIIKKAKINGMHFHLGKEEMIILYF